MGESEMHEVELLAALEDEDHRVRRAAAEHEHATEAVLRVAALDPDERVREAVATSSKAGTTARTVSVL